MTARELMKLLDALTEDAKDWGVELEIDSSDWGTSDLMGVFTLNNRIVLSSHAIGRKLR